MAAKLCELLPCWSSNVPKTGVFDLLQPLPGDYRSNDITYDHKTSHDVISCHVTSTSGELQPCRSSIVPKMRVLGLLQHFQVTSGQKMSLPGHFWSRGIISCHLTAISCKIQPCRGSNIPKSQCCRNSNEPKAQVFGLLLPSPGHFVGMT